MRPSRFALAALASTLAPAARAADDAPTFPDVAADADVEAGEIAVDVRDDASAADVEDLARTYGVALTMNSPWSASLDKITYAHVDAAREAELLDRLARDPRVEHAEPMTLLRASFVPNDPLYADKQWHLTRAGAPRAWDYACGRGVTVAVIDTGVACYEHGPFSKGSDLQGTRCDRGFDFVNDRDEASDDHGHGTHVAGTIAQTTNNAKGAAGLAYCATLMPVKVLTKQGWGTVADVAEGIRFAAKNGAQVINLSLGGPTKSGIFEDAVAYALGKGVVIVAAAGNSGRSVGYPAAYPGVVAVSATDANDGLAWFSSRGPELSIAAPGVAVTQQTVCDGGKNHCELFGTFNGTSMASPHVAGAAAMIVGLGTTDAASVKATLEATAREPRGGAEPARFGAGIVDAGAAAARTFWLHFAIRALALLAIGALVARRIRAKGGAFLGTPGMAVAAVVAGVGLLPFAPLVGLSAHAAALGSFSWCADLAARPFGEWDIPLLGAGWHRWMPFAGALPPLAIAALFYGVRRLRGVLGGFALGMGAFLAQLAITGDAAFVLGTTALRVWAVLAALTCTWLARVTLTRER